MSHQFHSRGPLLYPILMHRLHTTLRHAPEAGDETSEVRELVARALTAMNMRMCEYTNKEHCGMVWGVLVEYLSQLLAVWGM